MTDVFWKVYAYVRLYVREILFVFYSVIRHLSLVPLWIITGNFHGAKNSFGAAKIFFHGARTHTRTSLGIVV